MKKNPYINKEDLKDIFDCCDIFNIEFKNMIPIILVFHGIGGKNLIEIINLSIEDFDKNNNIIKVKRNENIYKYFFQDEWFDFLYNYYSNGYKIKSKKDIDDMLLSIMEALGNNEINFDSILKSGLINYIKENKDNITYKDYVYIANLFNFNNIDDAIDIIHLTRIM
ncbi:MAG: hypothetical protein ACOCP8_04765 [archaeon]